jgi:hypothetical protein
MVGLIAQVGPTLNSALRKQCTVRHSCILRKPRGRCGYVINNPVRPARWTRMFVKIKIVMAKLFVPEGACSHSSEGERFWPPRYDVTDPG